MITSLFSLIMFDSCLSKVSKKLFDNCFEEFGGRYKTHVMIDLEFCDIISKHKSFSSDKLCYFSQKIQLLLHGDLRSFCLKLYPRIFTKDEGMESFIKVSLTANILMMCFKINNNCNFPFNPLMF